MIGKFAVDLISRAQEFSSGLRLHEKQKNRPRNTVPAFPLHVLVLDYNGEKSNLKAPATFELATPGLQDQCSNP